MSSDLISAFVAGIEVENITNHSEYFQSFTDCLRKLKKIQKKEESIKYSHIANSLSNLISNDDIPLLKLLLLFHLLDVISEGFLEINSEKKVFMLAMTRIIEKLRQSNISLSQRMAMSYFYFILCQRMDQSLAQQQYFLPFIQLFEDLLGFMLELKWDKESERQDLMEVIQSQDDLKDVGRIRSSLSNGLRYLVSHKWKLPNFELVFKKIHVLVERVKGMEKEKGFREAIKEFEQVMEEKRKKEQIELIKDLPVIKVQSLTPRIAQEFLGIQRKIEKSDQQEEFKKLKRKQTLMKKRVMKELQKDQLEYLKAAEENEQNQKEARKEAFKRFKRQMDEHQLEYKRLKTMQVKSSKVKRKSKRVGGNKK